MKSNARSFVSNRFSNILYTTQESIVEKVKYARTIRYYHIYIYSVCVSGVCVCVCANVPIGDEEHHAKKYAETFGSPTVSTVKSRMSHSQTPPSRFYQQAKCVVTHIAHFKCSE